MARWALAMTLGPVPLALVAALVAILGLYRAGSFIHEVSHIKHSALPGFRLGWNLIAGIPLLVPSFMYEGVHNLHHTRVRYGTSEDPEYLPLAHMKPWTLPLFIVSSLLAPVALLVRYGVLTPLSLVVPGCGACGRAVFVAVDQPRLPPPRAPRVAVAAQWGWLEAACSVWAMTLIVLVATGAFRSRSSRSRWALRRASTSSIRCGRWSRICGTITKARR